MTTPIQHATRYTDEVFLTTKQLAALLQRKEQTIRAWRLRGYGPKYIRTGNSLRAPVLYRLSDVIAWLNERTFNHTAEEQALSAMLKQLSQGTHEILASESPGVLRKVLNPD